MENMPCMMKACREENYLIVAAFVRAGYRLRCKPLKQDERSREADQDHLDDQVYKLHILRAMAKPCYIMACYCTVGEQPQSRVGRQGLTNRQDSTLSFASISNFGWKKESILNLASVASIDRQSA